ncbi:SIMPL domain-containing protein [Brevibacillus sp. SYSU BS000544]|uniref:SIMPL domain-containing protein n=1 Tax=Brevibacillus sp. SYSU BS000544 TaxID=3416443 RepID=UPI003CE54583
MIEVVGEGRISTAPDQAIITLGVMTEGQNLEAVQKENNEKTANIIRSLMAMGIPKEDIKTSEYRIDTMYDYVEGRQIFRGYRVTHLLQITINQVGLTGRVVDTAVSQGANTISNIQFTVSKPDAFYNRALSLAYKDSLSKATTLASTMGVVLSKVPASVQELTQGSVAPVPYQAGMQAKALSTPIQPGEVEIVARVLVKYYFQ